MDRVSCPRKSEENRAVIKIFVNSCHPLGRETFEAMLMEGLLKCFVIIMCRHLVQAVGEAHMATVLILVEDVLLIKHGVLGVVGSGDAGHGRSSGLARQVVCSEAVVVLRDLGERLLGNKAGEALGSGLALGLASSDSAGLATALDSLVAVLVVLLKVLKQLAVLLGDVVSARKLDEELGKVLDGLLVEVVLVSLHVTELREGLVAVIKLADIGLHALVSLLVGADVATLSKGLSTDAAGEGLLAGVAAHVSLEIATLGEGEATVLLGADVGLGSSVSAAVDVQVSLLDEALVAAGTIANPLLLGLVLGRSNAAGSGRLGGIGTGSVGRSRALGSLKLGLRLPPLDSLHELVNVGLEVDLVIRVDGLVVGDSLGVGSGVRRDGGAADGGERLAAAGWRRNLHLVDGLGVTLEDHGAALVGVLDGALVLVIVAEWRANGRCWRWAVVRDILEGGSLILRSSEGRRRGLRVVGRANNVLRSHGSLLLHLRRSSTSIVWQETLAVHHVEVVGHVLRPTSPVGVRSGLSSKSHWCGDVSSTFVEQGSTMICCYVKETKRQGISVREEEG